MSDAIVNQILGNEPESPVASSAAPKINDPSADIANGILGNEQGSDEMAGVDQRLANYDKLQSQYGTIPQQALTAAEGAAQGLAGPVATAAEAGLTKLGVPGLSPEAQEFRAKANPIARYGTEATAFGVSALYGVGEAGLLAKIGAAANDAAGLAKGAKIARAAVSTGSELAALQSGNEISKAINGDPGQTLGTAAINVGLAGILGAAGGAAIGSVGPLWKSYTKSAAEDAGVIGERTAPVASGDDILADSIMKPKEKESFLAGLQKQKPNAEEIQKAGDFFGAPVSSSQKSASDYVQSMDSALSQSPTLSGVARRQEIDNGFAKIGDAVDGVMGSAEDSTAFDRGQTIKDQIQNKVDTMYQPLKEKYANRLAYAQTVDIPDAARLKQYDKLIELSHGIGEVGSKEGQEVRNIAERALAQNTVADYDKLISRLGTEQRMARISGNTDLAHAIGQASESIQEFQINQTAKIGASLQSEGAEHAEAIASDLIKEHKALKAEYRDFKETLTDLLTDARLGKRNATVGGVEQVLENVPNEKLVDKMFDPKNAAGLQRLREKFPDVFKTVIDGKKADLARAAGGDIKALLKNVNKLSPEIQEMMFNPQEKEILDKARIWIDSLPKNVGPSGTPKGMAFMAALQSHPLTTIVNNTKDFAIKNLLRFASPSEIEANKVVSDYINTGVKGAKLLSNAAKAFFTSSDVVPKHLLPNDASRDRLKKQLDAMNEDKDSASNIGGGVGHYLPGHATAAGMMAATAQNYFNALKPKAPPSAPLDAKPPVNKFNEAKYNRALDIAQQPLLVLKHAKSGTLQAQDVQTLNTIYPSLHSQIVSKLSEQMNAHLSSGKPIPYVERRSLSMLLGVPLDSTMGPQAAQSIMMANAGQIAQQNQPQQGGKTSGTAMTQINKVNKLFATASEKRQMKG